jgi:hypothetical protein
MSRSACCFLFLVGVFPLALCFAGEEKDEPEPPKADRGAAKKEEGKPLGPRAGGKAAGPRAPQAGAEERRKNFKRVREILMKNRRGEEITEEERAFISKNAPRMERMLDQRRPGQGPGGARPPGRRRGGFQGLRDRMRRDSANEFIAKLNVVDRASLMAATMLFEAEAHEEALATVSKVNETSPDTDAVGFARLLMGRFLLRMEEADKGREILRVVTGRAAPFALQHLLQTDQTQGQADRVIVVVNQMMAAQKSALDRCRVVLAVLEGADRIGLDPKPRAEVLKAVAAMVSREDAMANQELLAKERESYGQFFRGMGRRERELPWRRRARDREKGEPPGRAMKRRMKELGDAPPDRRRETMEQMKANIRKKLESMGEGGDPEVRKRLEKNLEKIEKLQRKLERKKARDADGEGEADERARRKERKRRKKEEREGEKEGREDGPVEGAQF